MNHWGGGGGGGSSFQKDELKGRIYDRRLYGKMLWYLKPYLFMVFVSFFILMLITASEVIIPMITRVAIDDHIVSDKTVIVYDDPAEAQEFARKYEVLKLHVYDSNGQSYIVLSTKETNKIDARVLQELKSRNLLSPVNIYIVKNTESNREILARNLEQNLNPRINQNGIDGWFTVGEDKIIVCQSQINTLPASDRIALRDESSRSLMMLALLYLGLIFIRLLSGYGQSVMTATYSQKAMNDLRHDVFAHLQRMPVKFFDTNPVGRLVTRVTNDIRTIDEMLASGVITIVQDVILVLTLVVLMLVLNWKLALISFLILPLVFLAIKIYKDKTRVVYREVRRHLASLNATLAEHIAGQKIIQLFNQYFHKRDEFARINQDYFNVSISQMKLFAFFRPIIHVSSQISVALIIWFGGGQILRNVITIGLLMQFIAYVQKLFQPINEFSEKFNLLQGALAGAERIFDLMDQKPEDYRSDLKQSRKFEGEIEFNNVWLAYNEGEWVLKDISFKIKPG